MNIIKVKIAEREEMPGMLTVYRDTKASLLPPPLPHPLRRATFARSLYRR